jgi:ADP-heptose:LPS heptosyltransferase
MTLPFLRGIDRWIGTFLLYALGLPCRLFSMMWPAPVEQRPRIVLLKPKGGGSLIIALPALTGLRRQYPQAEFILVCTQEARIYAELTGLFDRYQMIDDETPVALALSGLRALRACFHATVCIDLEHNSVFAGLFTLMLCAGQSIGLVKPEQPGRALAYVTSLSFNPAAPIYIYYEQICEMLGGVPPAPEDCRAATLALLPPAVVDDSDMLTVGIAPFTSGFAPERMMPFATWAMLLRNAYSEVPLRLLIFGAPRNEAAARELASLLQRDIPYLVPVNLCGQCTLGQSAATLAHCDELWAVDSGLLHIARLLGVSTRSFWGPTQPLQRLRPVPGLKETIAYRPFLCSPCVQSAGQPPCGGNNLCMITMTEDQPDLQPSWVRKS